MEEIYLSDTVVLTKPENLVWVELMQRKGDELWFVTWYLEEGHTLESDMFPTKDAARSYVEEIFGKIKQQLNS